MRKLYICLLLTIICGCINPEAPQNPTTTLQKQMDSLAANELAKKSINGLENYSADTCTKPVQTSIQELTCPGCYDLNYSFDCQNLARFVSVSIEGGEVKKMTETPSKKKCILDGDCVKEGPYDAYMAICDGGLCSIKDYDTPSQKYCLMMGHRLKTLILPNGGTYTVCKFINGNQCEEQAYYLKWCTVYSENLTSCVGYDAAIICQYDYNPVCAKTATYENSSNITRTDYTNACLACTSNTKTTTIKGYTLGTCPTSTTIPSSAVVNAAKDYCENNGYAYRMKRYPSGREYPVCMFGIDDWCIAEDYFQGRCKPNA